MPILRPPIASTSEDPTDVAGAACTRSRHLIADPSPIEQDARVTTTDSVRVGLLHTTPAHAGTFHDLVTAGHPAVDVVHVVDPGLLSTAIREGVTDEVYQRVAGHVGHLIADGATAVRVTCSSIGEAAEAAAAIAGVPVLPVDAPMAAEAVAGAGDGGRIAVLATLRSTLAPTGRLIQREVDAASAEATVTSQVVDGAADARAAGDSERHDELIREAVRTSGADVIVLAQASMAEAVADLDVGVPIVTSPAGGVAALLAAVEAPGSTH